MICYGGDCYLHAAIAEERLRITRLILFGSIGGHPAHRTQNHQHEAAMQTTGLKKQNPTAIEAVVWNIDGTLIGNTSLHDEAIRAAIRRFNIALAPMHLGKPLSWEMIRGHVEPDAEAFVAEYSAHYASGLHRAGWRADAVEAVRTIAALGVPQIAISTAPRDIAVATVKYLGLVPFFLNVLTADDVVTDMPGGAIHALAVLQAGCEAGHCLAVENAFAGAASAYHAGFQTAFWPDHAIVYETLYSVYHWRISKAEALLDVIEQSWAVR